MTTRHPTTGRQISERRLLQYLKRLLKRLGLKGHLHTFRHSFISFAAIGVFIWNQTRREYDHESGKWVKVRNPRSEWEVLFDPTLAIVPLDLWRAASRKLAEARRKSPLTGRRKSRNQRCPTTLLSGTLICEYCGNELTLYRSKGKYQQMFCLNGRTGAHGCRLSSSKSTRVIEDCLLGFLRDAVFSDAAFDAVVTNANAFLEEEAHKPQVDTAPMKAEVRQKEAAIAKLVQRVVATDDPDICNGYDRQIAELQRGANRLNAAIRDAEVHNRRPCQPLDVDSAKAYLADLRKILNQEIPAAAEAISTLTGPIKIRQDPMPGNEREIRWIATFSPDFSRLLRHLAKDDPQAAELLVGACDDQQTIEVPLEAIPKYEKLASKARRLREQGMNTQAIATQLGVSWGYAKQILLFADTGQRPKWH